MACGTVLMTSCFVDRLYRSHRSRLHPPAAIFEGMDGELELHGSKARLTVTLIDSQPVCATVLVGFSQTLLT